MQVIDQVVLVSVAEVADGQLLRPVAVQVHPPQLGQDGLGLGPVDLLKGGQGLPAAQQDHVLPSHAVKGDVRVFEMTQHETLLPSPRQVLRRSQGGGQVTRGQTLPPGGVRIGGGLRCK